MPMWEGKPRKLMVQANRNGFFYVLDRTNGKFLLGRPYTTQADLGDRSDTGRPAHRRSWSTSRRMRAQWSAPG